MHAVALSLRNGLSSRNVRLRGQAIVEYLLLIGICGLVILFAGPGIWKSIENHFGFVANSIENADGSGTGEDSGSTDPKADPVNGTAFAVYSADDGSLNLYKRDRVPAVGDTFNNRKVTAVYTGLDGWNDSSAPWDSIDKSSVETVSCIDEGIKPKRLEKWFYKFSNLKSVELSKLNTSNVLSLYGLFMGGDENLQTINGLENWDTSRVKNMSCMFWSCSSLRKLNLSRWNTSDVTTFYGAFQGCSALTNIDISNWDVSNAQNMSFLFFNCSTLTTTGDLSSWNTSRIENMETMFFGCTSLKTVGDISRWNVANATNKKNMFSNSGITPPSWYKG